jgi:hypothetical protein
MEDSDNVQTTEEVRSAFQIHTHPTVRVVKQD